MISEIKQMDSQDQKSAVDIDNATLIRMKEIMANQCFAMSVKVNMAKRNKPPKKTDADLGADQSKYEHLIEHARESHFNKTLALNRMQVWNSIIKKVLQDDDDDAKSLKATVDENAGLCKQTLNVVKETRDLEGQLVNVQKQRLALKRPIKKKMQEIKVLKQIRENHIEAQKQALERAEAILQKYKNLVCISQNILRGIILGSRVNWIDDPKLKDIAMGLESIPE